MKFLVVDSAAFIKGAPVHEYAENIYTVEGVVKEIRDVATRQRLQFLPYKLHIKEPSQECCKYVLDFSKKTGDFASLSVTDLQVLALTYQLEKENVGTDHLNSEPKSKVLNYPTKMSTNDQLCGFYLPSDTEKSTENEVESPDDDSSEKKNQILQDGSSDIEDSEQENILDPSIRTVNVRFKDVALHEKVTNENDQNSEEISHSDGDEVSQSDSGNEVSQNDSDNEVSQNDSGNEVSQSDSDDEGWITPNNISEIHKKLGAVAIAEIPDVTVACITTDFAMQNVLLQIGLHVLSVNGMHIKHTNVFILRCYACYKVTNDVTKQFCFNCGNKTLKKVSMTINEDGSRSIHINFKKRINIRGQRYSLPTPRSGRHANNPVLCADQPQSRNRPPKSALKITNAMSPDYEAQSSPFAINDVNSRAARLGIRTVNGRSCNKNPNAWSKRTGNKKSK